jgi:hypothetical protein
MRSHPATFARDAHPATSLKRGWRAHLLSAWTLLLLAGAAGSWTHDASAAKQTVCSITVNSPDEKETFRRSLPADKFDFVELVEKGRPDWLASACRQGVRCDVLVVSGHYDGGSVFFSDRLDGSEYLPVDEMERVSCSNSCPGLFSQLKEVYLFGCNTLNAEALQSVSAEIGRSLVRSGHSQQEAARLSRALDIRHGASSLDRMRQIFKDVPLIYGFSSTAPVGPTAAAILDRHFRAAGVREVASGRVSAGLLEKFRAHSMVMARGMGELDPQAAHREDVCRFADDRVAPAQTLSFVHGLLGRDIAEVRMFLDRIERYTGSLDDAGRRSPPVARAFEDIARDDGAQSRYLEFARDADQPAVRARMLALARNLGWLTLAEERAELILLIGGRLASTSTGAADVDLACSLNEDGELDAERHRLEDTPRQAGGIADAAIMACLGSADGHAQTLNALTGPNDGDVKIAQVYLRHRPIADVAELRAVTRGIARMRDSPGQVLALNTLATHRLSDPESLESLTQLFPMAESSVVQTAIAGVLIRSDYEAIETADLLRTLREHRMKNRGGENMVDVLIRRLQAR